MLIINDKVFEATKAAIIIEVLSYSGSAFAVTKEGEQVFVNQRIVGSMNLSEGDCVTGYLMPNYPDKKDQVPWRAIRVEKVEEPALQVIHGVVPELIQEPSLPDRIYELMEEDPERYFTTADLSDELNLPRAEIRGACHTLHRNGKIARADVHAAPDQKRASFTLWAISTKTFAY